VLKAPLYPNQSVRWENEYWTRAVAVLFGWEDNRRSGDALVMLHRLWRIYATTGLTPHHLHSPIGMASTTFYFVLICHKCYLIVLFVSVFSADGDFISLHVFVQKCDDTRCTYQCLRQEKLNTNAKVGCLCLCQRSCSM